MIPSKDFIIPKKQDERKRERKKDRKKEREKERKKDFIIPKKQDERKWDVAKKCVLCQTHKWKEKILSK